MNGGTNNEGSCITHHHHHHHHQNGYADNRFHVRILCVPLISVSIDDTLLHSLDFGGFKGTVECIYSCIVNIVVLLSRLHWSMGINRRSDVYVSLKLMTNSAIDMPRNGSNNEMKASYVKRIIIILGISN